MEGAAADAQAARCIECAMPYAELTDGTGVWRTTRRNDQQPLPKNDGANLTADVGFYVECLLLSQSVSKLPFVR